MSGRLCACRAFFRSYQANKRFAKKHLHTTLPCTSPQPAVLYTAATRLSNCTCHATCCILCRAYISQAGTGCVNAPRYDLEHDAFAARIAFRMRRLSGFTYTPAAIRRLDGRSCGGAYRPSNTARDDRRLCARLAAAIAATRSQASDHTWRVEEHDIELGKERLRLDAFISSRLEDASRAKVQSSIRDGLVTLNSKPLSKASHPVRPGDIIWCQLPAPKRLAADPEALPLEVVYEDDHVLVVNKAAGMVVHPSPGHETGTLVNALLHHCGLPAMRLALGAGSPTSLLGHETGTGDDVDNLSDPAEEEIECEDEAGEPLEDHAPVLRPGIVHRLDKGTTGLLVVAKDDVAHMRLCEQFKEHSVERKYLALTIGLPKQAEGTVETNIGRDTKDPKKMAVFGFHSSRGRHAVSQYNTIEPLAGGRAALVQWRLQTGRTHQIRVHAKHMGHPIFGDDTYSGGASSATNFIALKDSVRQQAVRRAVKLLGRPALHAQTLGFDHPVTGKRLQFTSELPTDFREAMQALKSIS